jgi:peptidoglycan/LPS O-acetylase OafA/YrhL
MPLNGTFRSDPLTPPGNSFDVRLESLRGWAALSVLIAHSLGILRVDGSAAYWSIPWAQQSQTGRVLILAGGVFNPGVAVILFFVLSGYVLTLSLERAQRRGWAYAYAIRRLFRLFPPMWASLIATWCCLAFVSLPDSWDPYSAFFTNAFGHQVSGRDAVKNAVLFEHRLNPVTWTMAVEFVGSAFVPVSIILVSRYGRRMIWFALVVFCVVTLQTQPSNYAFHYILCFQVGVTLAMYRARLNSSDWFLSPGILLAIGGGATIWAGVVAAETPLDQRTLLNLGLALIILVAVLRGAASRILGTTYVRHVGRISYSLYLFHLPVLYLVGRLMAWQGFAGPGMASHLIVVLLSVAGSLLVANIGFFLFEQPAMALGRRWAQRVQNTP